MDTTSDKKPDEMPEFFLEKGKNVEEKKADKKSFGLKKKKTEVEVKKSETSLIDPSFNRNKLFSKGINRMADEKLEDASHIFEMVLRINPNDVDALLN